MLSKIFSQDQLSDMSNNLIDISQKTYTWDELREKGIIIFGAGLCGKVLADQLASFEIYPDWFVDNNKSLWGMQSHEVDIRPAESLREAEGRFVILTSGYARSMRADCLKAGCNNYILVRNLPGEFVASSAMGATWDELNETQNIYRFYDLLADDISRVTLKAFLAYQLTLDTKYFEQLSSSDLYFPANIDLDYSTFVDVGAFTGDTLQDWIRRTEVIFSAEKYRYFAFEPGPQFALLTAMIESLPLEIKNQISAFNCALGDRKHVVKLNTELCPQFLTVSLVTAGELFSMERLDDVELDRRPTFLKLDVEGAEKSVLLGALQTLKKYRPDLAISVYNKRGDVWELPLWLHDQGLGYRFYLRQHCPRHSDTVCYAICR